MSDVSVFLLVISSIFMIGIVGELVFAKTGIPDVVWLIVVGIILGPVSGLVSKEGLMAAAPYFGALTLVVVLFNGGSELKLSDLSKAAGRGSMMAVLGFILAVATVAPIAMAARYAGLLPDSWTWLHAIMLGTILGGSSSVVIMPALAKAGLSPKITNLVNLESALTDVLSVVATGAVIQILAPSGIVPLVEGAAAIAEGAAPAAASSSGAGDAAMTLLKSFGIGVSLGLIAGLLGVLVLRRLRSSSYAYPLILGGLLVLYVIIDELGGSAALGILTAAVMVGNAPALSKTIGLAKTASLSSNVRGVHGEMTFIIKSFFFTFIGAMLGPPWGLLFFGVFIGIVLLVARVPNVAICTVKSGMSKPARGLVGVLFPRGMAAGVLAMMPSQAGIPGTEDLPVVVFAAVFTTILLFAGGFPILKKRLPESDLETPAEAAAKKPPPDASMTGFPSVPPPAGAHTSPDVPSPALGAGTAEQTAEPALGVEIPSGPADATTIEAAGDYRMPPTAEDEESNRGPV